MKLATLAVLLPIGLALANQGVVHMSQEGASRDEPEERHPLYDYLTRFNSPLLKSRTLTQYEFKNCGDPKTEVLLIDKLAISPDPLPTKGTINITIQARVKTNITSPLKAVVTLKKKILDMWLKVPCMDDFGSCTYPDLCQMLGKIKSCPPLLVSHHIPCHCPFAAGNYSLPGVGIPVDLTIIPSGDYSAKIELSTAKVAGAGCYEVQLSLK